MMRTALRPSFKYIGSPMRMSGDGRVLSSSSFTVPSHPNNTNTNSPSSPMTIHALSGYISTLYLCQYPTADGGSKIMLLDAGMPRDIHRVEYFINNVLYGKDGVQPKVGDVDDGKTPFQKYMKMVVSSHAHPDHVGSVWAFRERGVQVAVADRFEDCYKGVGGKTQQFIDAGLALWFANRLGRRFEWPFTPLYASLDAQLDPKMRLVDGMQVPGFEDWVAISCPGHTGHMNLLYHPESHVLYAADFFVAHKNEFRAPVPVDVEYAYSHSLQRLKKLPVRRVLLAHGGIIDCEKIEGGWEAILADVDAHREKKDGTTIKLFRKFLLGYTPEPAIFNEERLSCKPLPEASSKPPLMSKL